jgi:DNA-binding beta-propeller fold protein YncE
MARETMMKRVAVWAMLAGFSVAGLGQAGPYKVLQTVKAGGEGGFDYVYADSVGRRLYVPRSGPSGKITVFDLDTLAPVGELPNASGHGVAVDDRTGHGFLTSKPVTVFVAHAPVLAPGARPAATAMLVPAQPQDTTPLTTIKTIEVQGGPDGILANQQTGQVYILSHSSPNLTVLDARDGAIAGSADLGGAPEEAVLDYKGRMYVDLEDKGSIAVVDTGSLKVVATYDLAGKGAECAGLAMDTVNMVLFAACRNPQTMVAVSAVDGKILATLPIGAGVDGAVFNPATMEVFASAGDGTLTVVKESSPTSFAVEQTVTTAPRAKTLTLDAKTGRIYLIAAEFGPPAAGQKRGVMVPGTFEILVVGK